MCPSRSCCKSGDDPIDTARPKAERLTQKPMTMSGIWIDCEKQSILWSVLQVGGTESLKIFAPFLAVCRVETRAETLSLSSPFRRPSCEKRGTVPRFTRAEISPRQPPTQSETLSERGQGMATRKGRRRREQAAAPQETEAQLHALMQASARVRSDTTPPKLLTVRVPQVTAPAPTIRDERRRQPRGARAPRQAAALAQARQTLRALLAAYGAAVVWQEVIAPVYAAHTPIPPPAAPVPANAMSLSTEELSQVFGVTVVAQP
jgi:hypothetical protein